MTPLRRILLQLCCAAPLLALQARPAGAAELAVSAASSLDPAFRELAALFEAAHPGTRVTMNFGASGALLQQIARGTPADVFASADQATMDRARALVLVAQRRNFATNALVVIVPAASSVPPPATLADLARPAYARIALGQPTSVPAGRYAQEALQAARLWATIQPRVVSAANVRQALDQVARGEADAGFVYATDAARMPTQVKPVLKVATPTAIVYAAAPLAAAAQPALAARFVEFLVSEPARAVLERHGFGKP